ncbi:SDR family NAD(P)-dependent oxidoreductase, partial [Paraglaciecola sp.]
MKRVLITGATSGIGKSLVDIYIHNGYEVVATGRDLTKLATLKKQYPSIHTLSFDITQLQQVLDAAEEVNSIDQLILNAGNCEYMETVNPFDSALFERVIRTNLLSVGYCLEAFLPKIKRNG